MSLRRHFIWLPTALLLLSVAQGQDDPFGGPADAGTDPFGGPGDAYQDPFAGDQRSKLTLQVLNADGSPAAGARVLVGGPGKRQTVIEAKQLIVESHSTGSMALSESERQPLWLTADEKGQVQVPAGIGSPANNDPFGGPRSLGVLPELLALGEDDQVGFLPAGSNRETLRLRESGEVVINVEGLRHRPSTSFSVLASWTSGFAHPTQPKELGYGQPDLHGMGWKFNPPFQVFATSQLELTGGLNPFDGPVKLSGSLKLPPGEVRLTIVPADLLQLKTSDQPSTAPPAIEYSLDGMDTEELRELLFYGGPSRIVSVSPGKKRVVSFDECTHSIELQTPASLQTLPEWDDSSRADSEMAVYLIRDIELPGDSQVKVSPGSPGHESLLMKHQEIRGQLPPVRIGRLTPQGTYRFDLLCPGTYHVRVGPSSDRFRYRTNYEDVGQPRMVRLVKRASYNPFAPDSIPEPTLYQIEFEPENAQAWSTSIVIGADSDDSPLDASPQMSSPQQKQLKQLRTRIDALQQQLDAAVELVDQLESAE